VIEDFIFVEIFPLEGKIFECSPDSPERGIPCTKEMLIATMFDANSNSGDGKNNTGNNEKGLIGDNGNGCRENGENSIRKGRDGDDE